MSDDDVKVEASLFPYGYCARCAKPIKTGQRYIDLRVPDGTEQRIHAECMGGKEKVSP